MKRSAMALLDVTIDRDRIVAYQREGRVILLYELKMGYLRF